MVKKIIGYILSIIGLLSLALSIEKIKTLIPITLPTAITNTYLIIIGIILVAVGIFLILKAKSPQKQMQELPIFQGKSVVGYRRD